MHKNWKIISKRIVVSIFIIFALSFTIFDFYKFSSISNKDFLLACNKGSIVPTYIQREGKKAVSLEEFLRGFSFLIDDKLNA